MRRTTQLGEKRKLTFSLTVGMVMLVVHALDTESELKARASQERRFGRLRAAKLYGKRTDIDIPPTQSLPQLCEDSSMATAVSNRLENVCI